jgi:arsenite methyltransferase
MKIEDDNISNGYSKAIDSEAGTVVSKTGHAKFANYSDEELSHLPADITEHSFGCGNSVAFSDVKLGETVLDLGCGAGLDLLLAAEKVGNGGRVIGVDFNQDMLALASKRIRGHHNIELREGRIEALPIESNSIDWVISNCVINLSNDKQSAFNEIARVLNQNGKMIVSDIVAENLPLWVRYSGVLRAACGGGVISEKQYLDGLSNAGLEHSKIIARQYYDPGQLAFIVSDAAPAFMRKIRCCGKQVLHSILTKLAERISKNLWSAKLSAHVAKE